MSNYVFGTHLSYQDYLQARSFERSLKGEISSSTRSIIASSEELQRENISVLRDLSSSVSSGFENISVELGDLSAGIDELNATFHWGFSELLTQTSRINDSLKELVRLAKTPAQTWAYEQFEIARDADRKSLFEEALEYLNRAINGYGGQTGYKLEYRFHFLLGRIRLGSFRNHSTEIVNLPEAEQSFLYAARYAAQDAPREAARALLAAGWAAYSRGEMAKAQDYTQQAISFDSNLAEAHFQLAKVFMHVEAPDQALPPLQTAIELDRGYTVKAASDGDFKHYQDHLSRLFDKLRAIVRNRASESLAGLRQEKETAEKQREREFRLAEKLNLEKFDSIVKRINNSIGNDTYFGYLDAIEYCNEGRTEIQTVLEEAEKSHKIRRHSIEIENRQRESKQAADESDRLTKASDQAYLAFFASLVSLLCCLLGPVGLILGIISCRKYRTIKKQEKRGFAVAAIVIGAVTTSVLLIYGLMVLLGTLAAVPK